MSTKSIALIACAVAAISSFMPWASVQTVFGQIDVAGTNGDGRLTIVLALIAGLFCCIEKKAVLILGMIACGIGALSCIVDIINVSSFGTSDIAVVTVGYGLYLCLVAFVVGFVELLMLYRKLASSRVQQLVGDMWGPPRRLSDVK